MSEAGNAEELWLASANADNSFGQNNLWKRYQQAGVMVMSNCY